MFDLALRFALTHLLFGLCMMVAISKVVVVVVGLMVFGFLRSWLLLRVNICGLQGCAFQAF
jgi:hypothetical protein